MHGRERCCKIATNVTHQVVQRELDCLSKVSPTSHGSFIRVSKLAGLVDTTRNGLVIGILEEYIYPTFNTGHRTLQGINMHNVVHARKNRWAGQIQKSVQSLHQFGVIWVDANDSAWLIDFVGGWTDGWIDEHLAGTIGGGTQPVENIETLLGVGS